MKYHPKTQYTHYKSIKRRKEREKGTESSFKEIMAENFPNLRKEMNLQVQEA